MGVVAKFVQITVLIFSHTSDEVPLYERFFVGVLERRGFNRNTLSPTLGIVNGGTPVRNNISHQRRRNRATRHEWRN